MKSFLIRWLITALSVLIVSHISWSGVYSESIGAVIFASLLLGFLNAFLRPVLLFLSLPLILLSLGLFYFVVNAVTLYLVGGLIPGFHVESFWYAVLGSILISIFSWLLGLFIKSDDAPVVRRTVVMERHRRIDDGGDEGGGPNIKTVRGRVIE